MLGVHLELVINIGVSTLPRLLHPQLPGAFAAARQTLPGAVEAAVSAASKALIFLKI